MREKFAIVLDCEENLEVCDVDYLAGQHKSERAER